jgi:hypothetical protein
VRAEFEAAESSVPAKTRYQNWPAETEAENRISALPFATRRSLDSSQMSRIRGQFRARPRNHSKSKTRWLGREESKLGMLFYRFKFYLFETSPQFSMHFVNRRLETLVATRLARNQQVFDLEISWSAPNSPIGGLRGIELSPRFGSAK